MTYIGETSTKIKTMKKKIFELLFQIIPVMIGVYLGFLVSNWSEGKQRKAASQKLVNNMLVEINHNRKRVKQVLDYHQMLRDSSRAILQSDAELVQPNYFEGTRRIRLANSAYNTGIQTGIINELSIDKIEIINTVYTFQNDYNQYGNMMMASLINQDFSDQEADLKKIVRFLSVTMTDLVIKENDLLAGYELIEKKLKEKD